MKTIIAGSRGITDYSLVCEAIARVQSRGFKVSEIVSGGARGVDSLGERWANENNVSLEVFPADWDMHGKAAGPIRNKLMAKYADMLIAIWDGKSRGTANMISEAKELGLKVILYLEEELRSEIKSNPIKSNPVFGKKAIEKAETGKGNLDQKTIELNGKFLTLFTDHDKNHPMINIIAELVEEVNKLKK